jgi:agmatine deiminase
LKYENVALLVPTDQKCELERRFKANSEHQYSVEIVSAEYNDIWVRDTLPTFAIANSGSLIAIDWKFNGWGRRVSSYAHYDKDREIGRKVAGLVGARVVNSGVTAEGGALAFDGNGLIVATKSVMFDKYRNQRFSKDALENALLNASCCSSICWLPGDRNESITTGHADGILSFAENNVVLFHWVDDETSPEYDVCDYNLRVFQAWADLQGRHYKIIRLSAPNHQSKDGHCASYVNFSHINGAVIVPKFVEGLSPADECAHDKIFEAFGGKRRVEMVDRLRG